ncbi:MAG: hypothetical protein EA358_01235 [Flavobacteriales bacterium]|nr:MAG: hypothetical protein EA358_01235 [Flavobacteriales bacterium]
MPTTLKKIKPKSVRLNWKPMDEVKPVDLFSLKITREIADLPKSDRTTKQAKEKKTIIIP